MKKLIGIILAGLMLASTITATALAPAQPQQTTQPQQTGRSFTHVVFAEDGTATWCGYCHFAREALDKIYTSGDYPFFYTCLVDDKNTHADARLSEYNVVYFPTVWFDGGNKIAIGASSESTAETIYRNYITQTGARSVSNVDVQLNVSWLGSGTMDITCTVWNNGSSAYTGHLHVYVTERQSSFGWKDTSGHKYTFPFLDYAFNQDLNVAAGSSWTDTTTWVGADHNDGHGHNFGSIQYGNIWVLAAVFNPQGQQEDSGDSQHHGYFTAHFADDACGFQVGIPVNHPPDKPSSPSPYNGATKVSINKQLSWACTDPDDDEMNYDVYFGTTSPPPQVTSHQTTKTYTPSTMQYETKYYWKVVARDTAGLTNESDIWSFTTGSKPDTTPPQITIVKPQAGYLYIVDKEKKKLGGTGFAIGKLTITANATDNESGVKLVSLYIDDTLMMNFTSSPYTYLWKTFSFGGVHTIKVVAYDNIGNSADQEVLIHKLF